MATYELDKAKGCCIGSFVLKFPLKEACGKEESSNRVSLYVHGKVSRLGGVWRWYHDVRLYYDACAWITFGRCLFAL